MREASRRLPRNARFRQPSRFFLRSLGKNVSGAQALERFARWRAAKTLLAGLETNGRESESGALASAGVPSPIQAGNLSRQTISSVNCSAPSNAGRELRRSVESECHGRDVANVVRQKVCKAHGARGRGILFKGIPGSQEKRGVPSRDRPLAVEHLSGGRNVQDGHAKGGKGSAPTGDVGHLVGPQRRLPPYPSPRAGPEIRVFPSEGETFHIDGATLRIEDSSVGVHGSGEASQKVGPQGAIAPLPVSGRLAECEQQSERVPTPNESPSPAMRCAGSTSEFGQVGIDPGTEDHLLGGDTGPTSSPGIHVPGEEGCDRGNNKEGGEASGPIIPTSRKTVRVACVSIPNSTARSNTPSRTTTSSDSSHTSGQKPDVLDIGSGPDATSATLVEKRRTSIPRKAVQNRRTGHSSFHGRLNRGMGDSVRQRHLERSVATPKPPHKLARTTHGSAGASTSSVPLKEKDRLCHDRQHDSGSLYQEGRRSTLEVIDQVGKKDRPPSVRKRDYTGAQTHSGTMQRVSGLSIQSKSDSTVGMDSLRRSSPTHNKPFSVGEAGNRSLRESVESPTTAICVSVPGPLSDSTRRPVMALAGRSHVRLPTDVLNDKGSEETSSFSESQMPTNSAESGERGLVSNAISSTQGTSDQTPDGLRGSDTTALGNGSPGSNDTESPPVVHPGKRLQELGFSEKVIERILNSRAASTNKQYKSKWLYFTHWATESGRNPLQASLPLLSEFLVHIFNERNVSVRTVKNYRSAISFHWKSLVGYEIPEQDPVLTDLFRSFQRERPIPQRHIVQWDIHLVLRYLQSPRFRNGENISDKDLTLKTTFLLALASGKRRSEIHALNKEVEWLQQGTSRAVRLSPDPTFVSKTHLSSGGIGALKPFVISQVPDTETASDDNSQLCVVRTLECYLHRTEKYRTRNQNRLIISFQRGTDRDVKEQTISRYVKEIVVLAHSNQDPESIDKLVVKAHSVRHVATSLKALRSCSLREVMGAGAWASTNMFLSHYVQSYTANQLSKLADLGGFIAAGATY